MRPIFLCLFSLMLLFAAGCSQQAKSVDDSPDKVVEYVNTINGVQYSPVSVDTPVYLVQDAEDSGDSGDSKLGNGIFSLFGDGIINVILLIVSSVLGGLWLKVRKKVGLVGELFLKAHEYTNDNKLSEVERTDLINRFFVIIGKTGGFTVKRE